MLLSPRHEEIKKKCANEIGEKMKIEFDFDFGINNFIPIPVAEVSDSSSSITVCIDSIFESTIAIPTESTREHGQQNC